MPAMRSTAAVSTQNATSVSLPLPVRLYGGSSQATECIWLNVSTTYWVSGR